MESQKLIRRVGELDVRCLAEHHQPDFGLLAFTNCGIKGELQAAGLFSITIWNHSGMFGGRTPVNVRCVAGFEPGL